jgi:hypothetical protein
MPPQISGVYLALLRHLSVRDRSKEGFVVRKHQRGLSSMETWCERWSIEKMKIRLRGFIILAVVGRMGLIIH